MDLKAEKYSLIEYIMQIKEASVLNQFKEIIKLNEEGLFSTSPEEMKTRTELSIQSIEKGASRSIADFKQEIETWKQNQNI